MAMKIARIPLQPYSRFHFGEFKHDVNLGLSTTSLFAHSDTLFSALVNSYASIGDAAKLVESFKKDQINISSLFYYLKNADTTVFFLPKPIFLETDTKFDEYYKLRNKIKFVSLSVWEKGFDQMNWPDPTKYKIIQNEFLLSNDEYNHLNTNSDIPEINIFKIVQSPKSPIRKNTPKDSIYYQADIEIANEVIESLEIGFYFLYKAEDEFETMLKDAVNILSKSGIGGEKNNMGQIIMDPVFEELNMTIESDKFTNISVVSPKNTDDFGQIKLYKCFIRGGRNLSHADPYKTIRLIKEGALVTKELKGQLAEIGTDDSGNKALRNGKAFLIPVL